jgi:hypothetical protein
MRTKQVNPAKIAKGTTDFRSKHAKVSPALVKGVKKFEQVRPFLRRMRKDEGWALKPVYTIVRGVSHRLLNGGKLTPGLIRMQIADITRAYTDPDRNPVTMELETRTMAMGYAIDKYPNEVTLETLDNHIDDLASDSELTRDEIMFLRQVRLDAMKVILPEDYANMMGTVLGFMENVDELFADE